MVTDIVMCILVIAGLSGITALLASRESQEMRAWLWIALLEYLVCAAAQLFYSRVIIVIGGDMALYANMATQLNRFLDANFSWASGELWNMLLQKPSAFDTFVHGGGQSNSASMYAICAWLMYFVGGSVYATHLVVTGLAMLGSLGIFSACRDAYPEMPPKHLFAATVLFPSVAFWTSTLHKESFCLMGMGALFVAWRGIHNRQILRVLFFLPIGLFLILYFRAPALPPAALGIGVYVALSRLQKARGADALVVGPIYFVGALGMLAIVMVLVSRVSPSLGLNQIGDTMAQNQQRWEFAQTANAGSALALEDTVPTTLSGQLLRFPMGLVNALFRPQLFDVHNVPSAFGAIEMTAVLVILYRAIRRNGLRAFFARIQRSPFLSMCLVITVVGCAFVGVVTFNLGTLARYRVPFLPFYGALVIGLAQRPEEQKAAETDSEGGEGEEPELASPIAARLFRPRTHRNQPIRLPIRRGGRRVS